ncbi:UNVERIFIED_ORG: hypothetical protein GGD59_001761 [Rhizobium esperanzae]
MRPVMSVNFGISASGNSRIERKGRSRIIRMKLTFPTQMHSGYAWVGRMASLLSRLLLDRRWIDVTHPPSRSCCCYINSAGNVRFVLRADTLYDFMVLETAVIHEVGAAAMLCEHCRKVVVTGPLAGRRAHAKYCSDRCRVCGDAGSQCCQGGLKCRFGSANGEGRTGS